LHLHTHSIFHGILNKMVCPETTCVSQRWWYVLLDSGWEIFDVFVGAIGRLELADVEAKIA